MIGGVSGHDDFLSWVVVNTPSTRATWNGVLSRRALSDEMGKIG